MAKRLNKKVALIGGLSFIILGLVAVLVVLRLMQNPEKFIADAETAWKEGEFEKAERNYLRARVRAKDNELKLELTKKLIDIYLETEQWPQLRGSWEDVLKIQPDNLEIRYARLKYFYIICDNGAGKQWWSEVETQATEFLELLNDSQLMENTEQWENPYYEKVQMVHEPLVGNDGVQRIGQYLYLLRGKAKLNLAGAGAVTEPDIILEDAIADLQKAKQLEPTNTAISESLAQAYIVKGNLAANRGFFDERLNAQKQALEILKEAKEISPDNPKPHVSYLTAEQNFQLTQSAGQDNRELLATFEPRYKELTGKFPESDLVYAAQAQFYNRLGYSYIDKAIEASEKARQIDAQNVLYYLSTANYLDFKSAVTDDIASRFKAIDLLNQILGSPSLKETQGPMQSRNINYRAAVYRTLAWLYLDTILNNPQSIDEQQKKQWLDSSEKAVYEIEQIYQSGEDPQVIKWQGIIDLAKGDQAKGIQKLYILFQQQKAANRTDTEMAYFLAKQFTNSLELGAAIDFYARAIKLTEQDRENPNQSIIVRRPGLLLDYAGLLIRAKTAPAAVRVINSYEFSYGKNEKSTNLLITALIESGEYEKAQDALSELESDSNQYLALKANLIMKEMNLLKRKIDRETIRARETTLQTQDDQETAEPVDVDEVKSEIAQHNKELVPLIKDLIEAEPNSVSDAVIINICSDLKNYETLEKAKELAKFYLEYNPQNIAVNTFVKALTIKEDVTRQQLNEIREQFTSQIEDPLERDLRLGVEYRQNGDDGKAKEHFKNIYDKYKVKIDDENIDSKLKAIGRMSTSYLFETAINLKDWKLAEELIDVVEKENLDSCKGDFFRARLAVATEEYDQAIKVLDRCIQQKPIFSKAYLMRGQAYERLQKNDLSIADYKQAVTLNPFDGNAAKALFIALYNRNRDLGINNTTDDRYIEAKQAIQRAVAIFPSDMELLGFYAYYIREDDPQSALSILQRIYNFLPTPQNALKLGSLASELAQKEINEEKRNLLIDLARETYERALQSDPSSSQIIDAYAKFYSSIGQDEKAEELITSSEDTNLRWKYYINSGRYEQAKQILDEIHLQQPQDTNIILGLLIVAERTYNGEDFSKISQKLIDIDDSRENKLIQVSGLINTGLINDADFKLQSYMEMYKDDPKAEILASEIALKQGKLDKALELANKSLQSDEQNAYSWYLRGLINITRGDHSQAITDITKSRSIKDNSEAKIAIARAYILSGKYMDAKTELSSIAFDPATPERARFLLELAYYQSDDEIGLQNFYQQMIDKFPQNVLWLTKAADYSMRGKNYEPAQKLYSLAWQISNQQQRPNINALVGLFFSLIDDNKLQQALEQAQQYVDSPYSHIALMAIAKVKNAQGDKTASVEYFKKAAEKVADNPSAAMNILRQMALTVGDEQVRQYCMEKINQNPDSLLGNYVLAKLTVSDGDFNKSVKYYDKCIDIVKSENGQADNLFYEKANVLVKAYERTSDNTYLNDAIDTFKKLLEKNPDNVAVLNNIAYILADNQKDMDKALKYAQKAQQLSPNSPDILDTYAYVLYKNSRFEQAEQYAISSIQLFEHKQAFAPVEVYEHLGLIKEETKDYNGAIDAYKKAIEAGGENLSDEQSQRLNDALLRIADR